MFHFGRKEDLSHLSKSSRFNLLFMRRTNLLAITMFVFGILGKLLYNYFAR
jgi:hypothetical protein